MKPGRTLTVPCGHGHKTRQITDNTVPRDLSYICDTGEDGISRGSRRSIFCFPFLLLLLWGKHLLKYKPHKSNALRYYKKLQEAECERKLKITRIERLFLDYKPAWSYSFSCMLKEQQFQPWKRLNLQKITNPLYKKKPFFFSLYIEGNRGGPLY